MVCCYGNNTANWSVSVLKCICSAQSENLRNLEIALHILRILRLHSYLEIVHYSCVISRLHNYSAQSDQLRMHTIQDG